MNGEIKKKKNTMLKLKLMTLYDQIRRQNLNNIEKLNILFINLIYEREIYRRKKNYKD